MKILLTGFTPFNGETVNPAWEAVKLLASPSSELELYKLEVPTAYDEAAQLICNEIDKIQPDYVLALGQAGGVTCLNIEYVGINCQAANIPDNKGVRREYVQIDAKGPAAYFATLPVLKLVKALQEANIPAKVSLSAGTFVCNDVLYSILHHCATRKLKSKCGFLHVPYLPEQVIAKPKMPSMALSDMLKGLEVILATLLQMEK
ncbi:pyroglutamyl-peptidase I [Amygdalobacter nucleatus]|uniref:pyroglutamyl-peptidase I n=1 Tax=Amygdalobacter nucleatus TaxID=3029274 RepID=UPI00279EC8A1|nr:pyroglutamyl-peptidase I [Amygdalobacter nucleatus]WEG36425.1 pyroglutamyl-peptidase I [Amygdalobacter nucleatus]